MTQGCKFLVTWKYGSEKWIPLKEFKESNPVDVVEFYNSKGIGDDPDFTRWVTYTFRKWDVIIFSINLRVIKTTHK